MVMRQLRFFAINSLLMCPKRSYAHYEPTATKLSEKFLDEATMYYNEERKTGSLPTVAGAILISMNWIVLGNDKRGLSVLQECADMANRLHLYDDLDVISSSSLLDLQDDD